MSQLNNAVATNRFLLDRAKQQRIDTVNQLIAEGLEPVDAEIIASEREVKGAALAFEIAELEEKLGTDLVLPKSHPDSPTHRVIGYTGTTARHAFSLPTLTEITEPIN